MNSITLRRSQGRVSDQLARSRRGAAEWIRVAAQQLVASLQARRARAAARRDLSEMSDYELSDIGLRRWDIEAVARGKSPRSE